MPRKKAVKRKDPIRNVNFGADLSEALDAYCAKTGRKFSDVVRTGTAKEIGQPELSDSVKMGRPAGK